MTGDFQSPFLLALRAWEDRAQNARDQGNEAEAWRARGILRAMRSLIDPSVSSADRGALLREAVRLAGDCMELPAVPSLLPTEDALWLQRFGLEAHAYLPAPGWVRWFRRDMGDAGWPDGLSQALPVDLNSRRLTAASEPDGALLRLSPHQSYRMPSQKAAMRALLTMPSGSTLLASLPTGAGKSLLFQLGTRWWQEYAQGDDVPVAVVVVPTIALALDHEATLREYPGLEASRALIGDMPYEEREAILFAFRRGEIPLLIMPPETAMGSAREALIGMTRPRSERQRGSLAGFIVDEAHIVESWGRSFRPDFQRLRPLVRALRKTNPDLRVLLLSATLPTRDRDSLLTAYGSECPQLSVQAGVPRTEFDLFIQKHASKEEQFEHALRLIDVLPRPMVIYLTNPDEAEALAKLLREKQGYQRLACFTGETRNQERRAIIDQWRADALDMVVATSAFGMGVDKANVRSVLHLTVPEDALRYYQEIGRGGRDGYQGFAVCLWTPADKDGAYRLALRADMNVDTALRHWKALLRDAQSREFSMDEGTGLIKLTMDLDAAHEDIGPHPGRQNRRWNLSVITLLQRAGAIEVLAMEETAATLSLLVHDERVLNDLPENLPLLKDAFALREQEKAYLKQSVDAFVEVLNSPGKGCMMARIYSLVEDDGANVLECGRCPACRSNGTPPPRSAFFGGLSTVWPEEESAFLPFRTVTPEESPQPTPTLITRLAKAGVQQFVVPDGWGPLAAGVLKSVPGHPGLVLEAKDLLGGAWHLAPLQTAVLLYPELAAPQDIAQVYRRVRHLFAELPDMPPIWVAPATLMVEGQSIGQIAGAMAPVAEATLDYY